MSNTTNLESVNSSIQASSQNTLTPRMQKLISDSIVKTKFELIKQENIFRNKDELASTDRKRAYITSVAERIEYLYTQEGHEFLIPEISTVITHLMMHWGLEKDTYLVRQTLPDKYKNGNKDNWDQIKAKMEYNRFMRAVADINSIDLSIFNKSHGDMLLEMKKGVIGSTDSIDVTLKKLDLPLEPVENTQFTDLEQSEKNRFPKAEISPPLSTPQELCENPEYLTAFQRLTNALNKTVENAIKIRKMFLEDYAPIDTERCVGLAEAFEEWNEFFRPYTDAKYRADHWQLIQTAFTKVDETSTKASKESRVLCAFSTDKNGNPVLRGLTKEQVDSMYTDEINFWRRLLTNSFNFARKMSDAFMSHKGRSLADRAVRLSPNLAHKS